MTYIIYLLIMNLGGGENNLNERIRKLRKALDLTQQKFADRYICETKHSRTMGNWKE